MTRFFLLLVLACGVGLPCLAQQRLQDVVTVQGERSNALIGYGLVVGLDGTGDIGGQSPYATQSIATMLTALGVALPPGATAQGRNVAAVMVTADLPTGAQPGQVLDVTVSSMGNARSLRGGTLLLTPLRAANGQIYAQAQGAMLVPGQLGGDRQTWVQQGHQSAGRIVAGARVELASPEGSSLDWVELQLKRPEYGQTQRVVEALRTQLDEGQVQVMDQRRIRVRMPDEPAQRVQRMAQLMDLPVERWAERPKVVVNGRTGTVVMNQAVEVSAFAVTHAMLTTRSTATPLVYASPPNYQGWQRTPNGRLGLLSAPPSAERSTLFHIPAGSSLESVVQQLNRMGTSPQDLISILQAMKQAGALQADLEWM